MIVDALARGEYLCIAVSGTWMRNAAGITIFGGSRKARPPQPPKINLY